MLGFLTNIFTGALPYKLIGAGLAIAAIGILVTIHISNDNARENKITELRTNITQLETDKSLLKVSNNSLEKEILRKTNEQDSIVAENKALNISQKIANDELSKLTRKLNSIQRTERIKRLVNSRKRLTLLRISNKQAACEWEHFDIYDGKCIAGRWRLNE